MDHTPGASGISSAARHALRVFDVCDQRGCQSAGRNGSQCRDATLKSTPDEWLDWYFDVEDYYKMAQLKFWMQATVQVIRRGALGIAIYPSLKRLLSQKGGTWGMAVFIFQSVQDRFDLRHALEPGASDTWYATRYRNEMAPGDQVYFWMGGSAVVRGLYGWGHLTSTPYRKESWDGYGVDLVYDVQFDRPISAARVKATPGLRDLLILKVPQGTNFLLTSDEARHLGELARVACQEPPKDGVYHG